MKILHLLVILECVAVGAVSLVLASLWAWRHFCYNKRDLGSDFVVPQYKAWTAEEMRVATHDFDAANVIGSGAVSTCYVGAMKVPEVAVKRAVAVKRLTVADYDEGRKSFVNEFKTLCKMRHRNLVKVLGYCVEGKEIALVMEYMERGDLDRCLHNNGTSNLTNISWEERVNVALDVAEGLVYLHHEYGQPIIHCDLKPKNILLSSDMVAKICDFGIAKLLEANETGDMSMSKLRGTIGYIAPVQLVCCLQCQMDDALALLLGLQVELGAYSVLNDLYLQPPALYTISISNVSGCRATTSSFYARLVSSPANCAPWCSDVGAVGASTKAAVIQGGGKMMLLLMVASSKRNTFMQISDLWQLLLRFSSFSGRHSILGEQFAPDGCNRGTGIHRLQTYCPHDHLMSRPHICVEPNCRHYDRMLCAVAGDCRSANFLSKACGVLAVCAVAVLRMVQHLIACDYVTIN